MITVALRFKISYLTFISLKGFLIILDILSKYLIISKIIHLDTLNPVVPITLTSTVYS